MSAEDWAVVTMTLRQKLAFLVGVVFIPLSFAIAYQLIHLYDHLRAESIERAEDEAQLATVRIEQLERRLSDEVWTAGSALFIEGRYDSRQLALFTELGARDSGVIHSLFDAKGRLLTPKPGSGEASVPAPPAQALTHSVTRTVAAGPRAQRGLIVYTPVRSGGKLVAVGAARVMRPVMERTLSPQVAHGIVLVTDGQGAVVYSGPSSWLSDSDAAGLATVRKAISGSQGRDAWMRFPGYGSRHVGTQLPLDGMTVGFYSTAAEAFEHIADEAALLTATIILTVLLSAIFARRYANDILTEVSSLSSASKRLAVGDFDVDLPTGANDEIGQLASDFSQMRASLQDAFASEAMMAEAASELGQAATIETLAHVALEFTRRLLGSDSVALTVLEPEGEPRLFSPHGSESLAYRAEALVPYSSLGTGVTTAAIPGESDSLLASFPLRQSAVLLGRIDVILPSASLGGAQRSELELVSSIAGQTSTALANIILYEREKLIAETLQDSLLTVLPRVPNLGFGLQYRPATVGMRIGGDFYDFVTTTQGLVVIVGDISGKGLSAARQTSISKGALRSFAIDDPSPDVVLTRANSAVLPQFDSSTFVTAFCALIDTAAETIDYSVAGHPPPLLLNLDGTVQTLVTGGPPLGVVEDTEYALSRIGFEPDQTLVIVSDGITEARGADGSLFGEQAVAEVVSTSAGSDAEKIAANIVNAAEEHAQGRLEDDLTVVVVSFAPTLESRGASEES